MERETIRDNYLFAILDIKYKKESVLISDLTKYFNDAKALVKYYLQALRDEGLIELDMMDRIIFTKDGLEIAEGVYTRRKILGEALIKLGVGPKTAVEDAERIERAITSESYNALLKYIKQNQKRLL